MDNQNDQEVEETLELPEVEENSEADATDWRAEAEKLQQKAIRQREKTKELKAKLAELETASASKPDPEREKGKDNKNKEKLNDFDYGEKAFLASYGIKDADERELVKTFMNRTGDDLDTIVSDEIFTAKLDKLREAKAVKDAIPVSSRRSSATDVKTAVDYWLDKPFSDVPKDLRRDVLNKKLERDQQVAKFGS